MTGADAGVSPEVTERDEYWMRRALELAAQAREAGEVPVGAVLLRDDEPVGEGWNRPIGTNDPSAHAEMVALREAGQRLGTYRLTGTVMYVTLEPCAMCAGAMIHARVARLVYAAPDPKSGACGSVLDVTGCRTLNHRVSVTGGVLAEQAGSLLREFFAARRR